MVTSIRNQPKRHLTLAAVALFLALALVAAIGSSTPALATSGGYAYDVPLVDDVNPDPTVVETTIVADEATVDIGNGVTANVQAFNGTVPGPEFRLNVGDTVIVHFKNQLDHPTGIHWHGIELANESDGTPLTQNQVSPGETFLYQFRVPRAGVYWYHPHHHASTNQVFKGLYGSIIVSDPNEAALQASGVLPPADQTLTMVLSDITVCKAPGSNDAATYDSSMPWIGGENTPVTTDDTVPAQQNPQPVQLCETEPWDEDGNPRAPFAAGDVPNIQRLGSSGPVNEGQTVLTNGRNVGGRAGFPFRGAQGALAAGAQQFDVPAGSAVRLQIVNAATTRFFRLRLTDPDDGSLMPLYRVGGQGGLLDHAVQDGSGATGFDFKYFTGEILLDPGDRADVVARIPGTVGKTYTLWTQDFKRTGNGFAKLPSVPVAHFFADDAADTPYSISAGTPILASVGASVEALGGPTGTLLDPTTFTPAAKPGLASQDIRLTQVPGTSLGINDVHGHHDFPGDYKDVPHPGSARYAKLGDTLELTVTNGTTAHHPFHLHGFSIQPIEFTKPSSPTYTWPYADFRDNIDIPAGYTLRFRVRLDDRAMADGVTPGGGLGRWVFHCHIFFHATFGMISEFNVVAPDGNERPYVDANSASVTVNEGSVATMTGTYKDPDGDAVTLTGPSLGTLTDNGNGTWSWSYTTKDGPDENRSLYVTATDAGGHKDQVAFALRVNNLPPTVGAISAPTTPVQINTPITASASFTDPGTGDTHTQIWNWGDGTQTVIGVPSGSLTASRSHTYTSGGLYKITLTIRDDDGGVDSEEFEPLIVFDPARSLAVNAKIDSPAGAYVANGAKTGSAYSTSAARYKSGMLIPSGSATFQFSAVPFYFNAGSLDWYVGAGERGYLQGTGSVNSVPGYTFLLSVVDGDYPGGATADKYRLKVWNTATSAVVYDSQFGAPINAPANLPLLAGSVVLH